jgi:hypothetical protein
MRSTGLALPAAARHETWRAELVTATEYLALERRRSYVPPQTKELPMPASLHYGLVTDRPNTTRPQPRMSWTRESPRHLVIRFVN